MDASLGTSDRRQPLAAGAIMSQGLNESLKATYIDIPEEDSSIWAKTTRFMAGCTGKLFTPRQILAMLRVVQTLTFVVLVFTVISDIMYIFFVTLMASDEVNAKVGGARDAIIRWYGLAMAIGALMIEFELSIFLKQFPGLKGYIPRSLFLFFIATITSPNPLHEDYAFNRLGNNDYDYDDDRYDAQVSSEIPGSTVRFQMVTSFLLTVCALTYFVLGILCFDRFTTKAFISKSDPVKATQIPVQQSSLPSHVSPGVYEGQPYEAQIS